MAVTVRELEPRDHPVLAEVDRQKLAAILPPEWDAWADEPCRTLVAFRGAEMAGAVQVAVVGRSEGWVEGLRTASRGDSDTEDALVQEALAMARRYGALAVRASAPDGRVPRWVSRHGFKPVTRFDVLVANASPEGLPPGVDVVQRKDAAATIEWLHDQATQRTGGLVPLGWRFRRFAAEIAAGAAREGRLIAQRDPPGAAVFVRRGGDRVVNVLFCAEPSRLLDAVRADLPTDGRVAAFVPAGSAESLRLRAKGLVPHPWCADGLVVVARTLAP
jgi:hypothetical protein